MTGYTIRILKAEPPPQTLRAKLGSLARKGYPARLLVVAREPFPATPAFHLLVPMSVLLLSIFPLPLPFPFRSHPARRL